MSELQQVLDKLTERDTERAKLVEDVHDIKVRLFEPDTGLYAREKENTDFRKGATNWLRLMGIAILGMLTRMFYSMFTNGR